MPGVAGGGGAGLGGSGEEGYSGGGAIAVAGGALRGDAQVIEMLECAPLDGLSLLEPKAIKKLLVTSLRELCVAHNLSSEGHRPELIARVCGAVDRARKEAGVGAAGVGDEAMDEEENDEEEGEDEGEEGKEKRSDGRASTRDDGVLASRDRRAKKEAQSAKTVAKAAAKAGTVPTPRGLFPVLNCLGLEEHLNICDAVFKLVDLQRKQDMASVDADEKCRVLGSCPELDAWVALVNCILEDFPDVLTRLPTGKGSDLSRLRLLLRDWGNSRVCTGYFPEHRQKWKRLC